MMEIILYISCYGVIAVWYFTTLLTDMSCQYDTVWAMEGVLTFFFTNALIARIIREWRIFLVVLASELLSYWFGGGSLCLGGAYSLIHRASLGSRTFGDVGASFHVCIPWFVG